MLITLEIDILQIAAPLVEDLKGDNFAADNCSSVNKEELSLQLNKKVAVFILGIEGAYQHLKDLDMEKSGFLLEDTSRLLEDFYLLDDVLSKKDYLDDQELKQKIEYLFRALYKFESILHKKIYKDSPVQKTPGGLLESISKINRNTLMKIEPNLVETENSVELTRHAMNLSQSSLAEDWSEENDEHWDSFL